MSTWKSNKVQVNLDAHDDCIVAEAKWEYQTTSDCFTYTEKVIDQKCSSFAKNGEDYTKLIIGPDTAKNLYHALSNWMRLYNSEKETVEVIENNIFDIN
jgi:hypothetical protein